MPLLYHELWKQNQSIKGETMTVRERMLRMKSRPKASYTPSHPVSPPMRATASLTPLHQL